MRHLLVALIAAITLLLGVPAAAQPSELDAFAREIDRVESVRAVKTLQRSYAQYAQYGLWNEVGALFSRHGSFVFDGQVTLGQTVSGPDAVAAFLRTRYGSGHEGPDGIALSTMLIENAIVNLTEDGEHAQARWNVMILHGGGENARFEGGIFENDYVREDGVWKIATLHYFPQFDGPASEGWLNWGNDELPVVPYHYDTLTAGIPVPPAVGPAPATTASLRQLQQRVDRMNDEDRVRNLQAMYGFYADRRMWDDVGDLFAADGMVEVAGQGIWRGRAGVRRWLGSMGAPVLAQGDLNDRPQFDVLVSVSPGGNEAFARGIEFGMLSDGSTRQGWWEVSVFQNRFVREAGVWKIREMRRFPLMKSRVSEGWGAGLMVDAAPTGANAPDQRAALGEPAPGLALPAFLNVHPVTGLPVAIPASAMMVADGALTGAIAPSPAALVDLTAARLRLARAAAFAGADNVSAAYGNYLDDSNPAGFAALIATDGFKMTPFSGYYITSERVRAARVAGKPPFTRASIPFHWLIQPVLLVSDDGRSATGRYSLFHPNTGTADARLKSGMQNGIYHNGYVLEDGVWRIWDLSLDEPYAVSASFAEDLWAGVDLPVRDPNTPPRVYSGGNFSPDIALTELGERQLHFAGGTGEPWQWPQILPMWFQYRNPVTGREPEFLMHDCVPCTVRPDLRFDAHGYQQPPSAEAANRSE